MWILSLIEQVTGFIPRPLIIRMDEAGFRQVPKLWEGWPWNYWPWIRWSWIKRPWKRKPWAPENKENTSTWLTKMDPGEWYWIIPWIMEYEICKTKLQIKDVRAQSVWTKDGKDIIVGTAISYYVKDAMKALLNVLDYDDSLQNAILGIVSDYIRKHSLEELKVSVDVLCEKLLKASREVSDGWGLKIKEICVTDTGSAQNIRLLVSGDTLSIGGND